MISLGIEARNVEKFIVHHDARIRFRKRLSKAAIAFNVRRQQPIIGINYQNVFDITGRNCRRAERCKANEDAGKNDLLHEYGAQSRESPAVVMRAQEQSPQQTNPVHRSTAAIGILIEITAICRRFVLRAGLRPWKVRSAIERWAAVSATEIALA